MLKQFFAIVEGNKKISTKELSALKMILIKKKYKNR